MTQPPEVPDNEPSISVAISAKEMEAALNAAFSPRVPDKIKRSLIAAMQSVVEEAEDE